MRRSADSTVDPGVFGIAVGISVLFVLWGVLFTDSLASVASTTLSYLITTYGWVFILATFSFLVFVVYLAFSRYGKIRLGKDDDRPEFRTATWIAMMFSAGMGIGLMFFGVAEPVLHFATPPHGLAEAGSTDAARTAMQYSYFHWALHPWAVYAVVGLALAYSTFRKEEEPHKLGVLSHTRGAGERPNWQGYRHPGDLRDPVWHGYLAGVGGLADQRWTGLPVGCWELDDVGYRDHPGDNAAVYYLGGYGGA